MGGLIRLGIIFSGLLISVVCVSGQDLGSSNKLFGGPPKSSPPSKTSAKPVTKAPAKAKVTPKPKPVATNTKAAAKKTTPAAKVEKPVAKVEKNTTSSTKSSASKSAKFTEFKASSASTQSAVTKPKFTEFSNAQPTRTEITPGKATPLVVTSGSTTDDRYEDLIEEGNNDRDDRNYVAAETAYKKAKSIKPKDARAIYGLGNLYSDQQRWEDAESSYRSALEIDPGNAIAQIALSYVLTQPLPVANLSDRYEEAEKLARRAIQQIPSNALASDQLGVALELRGMIGSETESAYRRAIKLDASFAPAYAHLGRLLRRRGLAAESAAAYKSAVQYSTDVATKVLVADVMQSEQRYAESEQLLRSAIAGDAKNPSALLLLSRALIAQAKFGDAERTLRISLDANPNAFAANSLLGTLYSRQGKLEMAENSLLQAARFVSPLEKRLLSQQFEAVGDAYMKAGQATFAARSYRQAITLDAERESLAGKLAKAQRG